jgi:hypothetical protein
MTRIQRGQHNVSLEVLERLAVALRIDVAALEQGRRW